MAPHTVQDRRRSFDRLYRRHRAEIFRAALRATGDRDEAEEVTQTAFLDAYRAWIGGDLPREPRAWLFAIAENTRRRRYSARGAAPRGGGARRGRGRAARAPRARPSARSRRPCSSCRSVSGRSSCCARSAACRTPRSATELDLSVAAVQMLLFRARRALRSRLAPSAPVVDPAGLADRVGGLARRRRSRRPRRSCRRGGRGAGDRPRSLGGRRAARCRRRPRCDRAAAGARRRAAGGPTPGSGGGEAAAHAPRTRRLVPAGRAGPDTIDAGRGHVASTRSEPAERSARTHSAAGAGPRRVGPASGSRRRAGRSVGRTDDGLAPGRLHACARPGSTRRPGRAGDRARPGRATARRAAVDPGGHGGAACDAARTAAPAGPAVAGAGAPRPRRLITAESTSRVR